MKGLKETAYGEVFRPQKTGDQVEHNDASEPGKIKNEIGGKKEKLRRI